MAGTTNSDLLARIVALETELKLMREVHEEEKKTLDEIRDQLTKYKGFIGGIVFLFTSVGAFLKTWPYISSFFSSGK